MLKWLLYYCPTMVSLFSNIKLIKYVFNKLKEEGYLYNKDNKSIRYLILEVIALLAIPFIPGVNLMNTIYYLLSRNDKSVFDDFYQAERKQLLNKGIIVEGSKEYKSILKQELEEKKIDEWCYAMGYDFPKDKKVTKEEVKEIEEIVKPQEEVTENNDVHTYRDAYALWNGQHPEIHECPQLPSMDEIRKMDEDLVLKKSIGRK